MINLSTVGRFLAIDPGLTSGLAWFERQGTKFECSSTAEIEYEPLLSCLGAFVDGVSLVICESFVVHHAALDLTPLKIIGILEYLCREFDVPLELQPPAFLQSARARSLEVLSTTPHALDAEHHGLVFLSRVREP